MASKAGRAVYNTRRWRALRLAALAAAGWRCQRCGAARRLEVHHRRRLVDGGQAFDLDNLEAVCRPCHFGEHRDDRRSPLRVRMREWARAVLP